MKRAALFIITTILLLTGCSENLPEAAALSEEYDDYFIYEANKTMGSFCISDEGELYLFTHSYSDEGVIENITLDLFGMDGSSSTLGSYEKTPVCMDISEGLLYCVYTGIDCFTLCSLDTASGKTEELCRLEEYSDIKRMDACGSDIYILGISRERASLSGEYTNEFGAYSYNGEKLIKIDISTGEITDSGVSFPIAYSMYGNDCVVYAADEDGYYFSDFHNNSKKYHDIEQLNAFDMYEKNRYVFTSGSGINLGKLCAGTTSADDGISQAVDDCFAYDVRTVGGYTFFKTAGTDADSGKLCRIKNSAHIKKNNKIRFISSDYSFDAPFGCGYTIDYQSLSADKFSLSVLSQDSSYDMSIINSYESFSTNIRDKGSFYPLNDIPEVNEYLEKCFPYIKEAATDKNGDIWMLPVRVDIPVIVYNEQVCQRLGYEFGRKMTVEEFTEVCKKAYNSEYKRSYSVHPYVFTQRLLIQYMSGRNSFDTAEFRAFADYTKTDINITDYTSFPPYMPPVGEMWNNIYAPNGTEQCLFAYHGDTTQASWLADLGCFKFAEAPSIVYDDKPSATCAFITVNPSTDNLEAALDYIASLAEYLGEQNNCFFLMDNAESCTDQNLKSLYEIYSGAQIGFNVSEEILLDIYKQYQQGNVSLDEMITESDRKLSAYLNE